jgi:chemotaxis protein methyltransferase WspC
LETRPTTAEPTRDALFAQARRLADVGQHAAALDLCRSLQERFGPCADVYSLAGVIHQARQDGPAAAGAFRKALYLEPDHREALTHLLLLCQRHGDQAQAAVLRRRLERLAAEEAPEPGGDQP